MKGGALGPRAWFVAICLVTVAAYGRSFTSPFQFDDFGHIVDNDAIKVPDVRTFLAFGRTRIIPFASLALNYRLGEENPFGYHVVNIVVHLLATFAVLQIALALTRTPRVRGTWLADQQLPFALGAAGVFACHPIQIQAVTYIVQRISSVAALFYVGAVLWYVRARNAQLGVEEGRPRARYGVAALLGTAAFFSKENSASLPLAVALAEWTFFGGRPNLKTAVRVAPFALLVLVIPLTWQLLGHSPLLAPGAADSLGERVVTLFRMIAYRLAPGSEVTPLRYFFTQCLVIPGYLRLVVLPWGFNVDHDVPLATAFSGPVAAGFVFLLALVTAGLLALRRSPVVGFGILWIFIALGVESSFFPIADPMVEHRMYLAMPGVALVLGSGFAWAVARRPVLVRGVGVAVVGLLATLTFLRNEVWRTPLALWSDAVAKSPRKARPHANLATALQLAGRREEAITQYCQALAIDPNHRQARSNLNVILDAQTEEQVNSGEAFVLEGAGVGPGGTLELMPRDPCKGRDDSQRQR